MLRRLRRVTPTPSLRLGRGAIDLVDGGLRRLLRLRQHLVQQVARRKQQLGLASEDPAREAAMQARARGDGERLGLGAERAEALLDHALQACRAALHAPDALASPFSARRLLRLLPPPRRLAPLVRLLPPAWPRQTAAALSQRALGDLQASGDLAVLEGRRLAIECRDLPVRWVVEVTQGALRWLPEQQDAEATIRGDGTDLLLLAARLEDADTLFFQRRLQLTGDVELGLTARNLLDRLPWEAIPLPLRIGLHRLARLARAARASQAPRDTRGEPPR